MTDIAGRITAEVADRYRNTSPARGSVRRRFTEAPSMVLTDPGNSSRLTRIALHHPLDRLPKRRGVNRRKLI